MIPEWKLQMMANHIFLNYLSEKDKVLALANSMLEAHIEDKEDDVDYASIIEQKCKEVERHRMKLSNFIDMRAEGEIDKEMKNILPALHTAVLRRRVSIQGIFRLFPLRHPLL